jgi:type I restriction enzyme M protein
LVNPAKEDKIIDPACGTSGFLISAYKHIMAMHDCKDENGKPNKEERLTAQELERMHHNFRGFDIDPTMIRTARVNMYLHGFKTPDIIEHDTLTSEDFWNDRYDVILANPPFMTPKGGIQPHRKFSVQANRSEVLFTDYIATHLKPRGRAGFIVPEGVIFQSGNAYKQLRKNLVEQNGLVAVISLPGGVFQPYSGVKTSILYLNPELARQRDSILFIKIENDGFSLGAQRRPIEQNDLPEALQAIEQFKIQKLTDNFLNCTLVSKADIAKNGEYNLSGDRYGKTEIMNTKWNMVELGEVLDYEQPAKYIVESIDYSDDYKTPVLTAGKTFLLGKTNETNGIFPADKLPVIIFDDFTTASKYVNFPFKVKSSAMKILHAKRNADIRFVYEVMQLIKFEPQEHKRFWISEFSKFKIPLPPLSVQREIVEKIAVKQRAIEAARQVIDSLEKERKYFDPRPRALHENWQFVKLEEVVELNPQKSQIANISDNTLVSFAPMNDLNSNTPDFIPSEDKPLGEVRNKYTYFADDDVLLAKVTPCFENGKSGIAKNLTNKICFGSSEYYVLRPNKTLILPEYLYLNIATYRILDEGIPTMTGTGGLQRVPKQFILNYTIPLPPISIQREYIAEFKREQAIAAANKECITIMETRIKETLGELYNN